MRFRCFSQTWKQAWLAVGNAIPVFDDTGVFGGGTSGVLGLLRGGAPGASWLTAAWVGASAVSNSWYQSNTGSSFAAPQVSGALALLAEAFPSLDARTSCERGSSRRPTTPSRASFSAGTVDFLEGTGVFNHDYSIDLRSRFPRHPGCAAAHRADRLFGRRRRDSCHQGFRLLHRRRDGRCGDAEP